MKYIAIATLAAAALAVAACGENKNEDVVVPADETAAANVELNADGSIATPSTVSTEAVK